MTDAIRANHAAGSGVAMASPMIAQPAMPRGRRGAVKDVIPPSAITGTAAWPAMTDRAARSKAGRYPAFEALSKNGLNVT